MAVVAAVSDSSAGGGVVLVVVVFRITIAMSLRRGAGRKLLRCIVYYCKLSYSIVLY